MGHRITLAFSESFFHPIKSGSVYRIGKVVSVSLLLFGVYSITNGVFPDFFLGKEVELIIASSTTGAIALVYIFLSPSKKEKITPHQKAKNKSLSPPIKSPSPESSPLPPPPVLSLSSGEPSSSVLSSESFLLAYQDVLNKELATLRKKVKEHKEGVKNLTEREEENRENVRNQENAYVRKQAQVLIKKRQVASDISTLQTCLAQFRTTFSGILSLKIPPFQIREDFPPFISDFGSSFSPFSCQSDHCKMIDRILFSPDSPLKESLLKLNEEIKEKEKKIEALEKEQFKKQHAIDKYKHRLRILKDRLNSATFLNNQLNVLCQKMAHIKEQIEQIEKLLKSKENTIFSPIGDLFKKDKGPPQEELERCVARLIDLINSFNETASEKEPSASLPVSLSSSSPSSSERTIFSLEGFPPSSFGPSRGPLSGIQEKTEIAIEDAEPYDPEDDFDILAFDYLPLICEDLFNLFIVLLTKYKKSPLKEETINFLAAIFREGYSRLSTQLGTHKEEIMDIFQKYNSPEKRNVLIFSRDHFCHFIYFAFNQRQFDKIPELLSSLEKIDQSIKKVNLLILYRKLLKEIQAKQKKIKDYATVQEYLISSLNRIKAIDPPRINFDDSLSELHNFISSTSCKKSLLKLLPSRISFEYSFEDAPDVDPQLDFTDFYPTAKASGNHQILLSIYAHELIPLLEKMFNADSLSKQMSYGISLLERFESCRFRNILEGYAYDHISERERDYNFDRINPTDQRAFLLHHEGQEDLRNRILTSCVFKIYPTVKLKEVEGEDSHLPPYTLVPHTFYWHNVEYELGHTLGSGTLSKLSQTLTWEGINRRLWGASFLMDKELEELIKMICALLGSDLENPFRQDFSQALHMAFSELIKDFLTMAKNPKLNVKEILDSLCKVFKKMTKDLQNNDKELFKDYTFSKLF